MAAQDMTQGAEFLPSIAGRIMLRRLDVGDLDAFQAYRGDPEVALYQGWESTSDDEARGFLSAVATCGLLVPGQWCQIAIALATNNALVGDIGIFISSDASEAELGVSLCRPSQGKGLASEAMGEAIRLVFAHTTVDRVVGITDIRNEPSIALLKRVGMRKVGEQESEFKGEMCRELVFAVTRDEAV